MQKYQFIIFFFVVLLWTACRPMGETDRITQRVMKNYSEEFSKYADWFAVPEEYLMALAAVEVSGRKEIPHRYEAHVHKSLFLLKAGKADRFENIDSMDLADTSAADLRKMAMSWGPFQLMGYKCFYLHIDIEELVDSSSFYGAQWIDLTYGDLLRRGDFKNAFHLHNTGKMYPDNGPPLTYDKQYVPKAMKYLQIFKEQKEKKGAENKISIRLI